jgi:hypothetical protein
MGKGLRLTDIQKDKIRKAKEEFKSGCRYGPLHMKLDCPDPHGSGGSTDTAALARKFFEAESRPHFLALVQGNDEEKEGFQHLHKHMSIILRLVSCKQKIDTDSFEFLCNETYLNLVKHFPWASVPQSIHRLLAHAAERIRFNKGCGLGTESEEGLETLHKYVRRFRSLLARKNSLADNLKDAFTHLWVRSDPVVRSMKRQVECLECSEIGHTKRSCPKLKPKAMESDDAEFKLFLMNDD